MQKRTFIICLLVAAVVWLCAACSHEDGESVTEETAVSFDVQLQNMTETRAGIPLMMTETRMYESGFGVMAHYTGNALWESAPVPPNFMYNQQVTYDFLDTHLWEYDPIKYWPNDNQPADDQTPPAQGSTQRSNVSFFAYAPFVEVTSGGIPTSGSTTEGITALTSNTTTGAPKVSYTLAKEAANQVDLLWGTRGQASYNEADGTPNTSDAIVNTDLTKQTTTERVSFLFKHALSCIDIYVQRIYDEVTPSGKNPVGDVSKIFVSKLQLSFGNGAMNTSGTLNLATGAWEACSTNTTDASLTISGDQHITPDLMGTEAANSNLTYVRNYELDDFAKKSGVTGTLTRLTRTDYATMLIPAGSITFTPTLSYSFVTQDDELALSAVTATDGTRYHRILHTNITGSPVTIKPLEMNKRYTLVCYIRVESVQFVIESVEDWDFPIRMMPDVTAPTESSIEKILNEE